MHDFIAQLIRTHHLDAKRARRLWQLSGLLEPPAQLERRAQQALMLTAATLIGAALVFFVAANWQAQTRGFKLLLLQAAVLTPALAACLWPRARAACLLLAMLALGALLAFVGQTYQTGADAWQLFALWALLALPWVVLARTNGLWAVWILIAATALGTWAGPPIDVSWWGPRRTDTSTLQWLRLLLWVPLFLWPMLLPALGLVKPSRVRAAWAVAACLALSIWVFGGLADLIERDGGVFYGANLLLVAGAFLLARRTLPRDYVVLALALMALNAMLLGLLANGLFGGRGDNWLGSLLIFTVATAAAVGFSGTWLYRLQRREGDA